MHFEAITPTEPSQSFLKFRFLLAQVTWFITEKATRLESLSKESLANLEQANQLLETHSGVVYLNHREKKDAALAIGLVLKYLPNAHTMLGPAGLKHFDKDRDRSSAMLYKLIRYLHVYALPVFQHNDKMQDRYSPEEIAFMSTQLRELSSLLMGNAHTIYGITPEGTRNEDGILTKARTGLGRLEQYHTPSETFYLPVGLIYPPHAEKNTIEVGKPILLPDSIDFSTLPLPNSTEDARHRAEMITDELMRYLAQLLPEESRGYYGT